MSIYQKYYQVFERGFIGYSTMGVLSQSCMGSIAAMAVLQNGTNLTGMIQLFFVIASCMTFNGAVLSQQKPKVVFNILLWSISISILVIAFNSI